MRVLINYLYQNYPYTTASYLEMALRADPRIEVFRLGENRIPCADLIINMEPCDMVIAYPGRKSCYWEVDNHIHRGEDTAKYDKVDELFVTQKYWMDYYPTKKVHWLPLAADSKLHRLYEDEPLEYDIGFLGNDTYPYRRSLLEKIGKEFKLLRSTSKPGEEYSRLLSRCKLTFNCAMNHDMNMRFFEAMSIGRMLLTDMVEGQEDVAKEGEHYIAYKGWPDLRFKIDYYLRHNEEREKIAKAGADWVHNGHTYADRLEDILHTCGFY
jgi:spore maturation protein CgeB